MGQRWPSRPGGVASWRGIHRHRLRCVPVSPPRTSGMLPVPRSRPCRPGSEMVTVTSPVGLGGQLHCVGRPRSVSLRHGEVRLAEHDPRRVVLRDAHLHGRHGRRAVAPTGDGVRQRHPSVRNRVIVLRRRNGHGLRNVPVVHREGQARLVQTSGPCPREGSLRRSRRPVAGSPGRGCTSWIHPQAPSGSAPMSSPRSEGSAADRQRPTTETTTGSAVTEP